MHLLEMKVLYHLHSITVSTEKIKLPCCFTYYLVYLSKYIHVLFTAVSAICNLEGIVLHVLVIFFN
jgi:hypothetical protein